MARGWESKSVEEQQSQAASNTRPGPRASPALIARQQQRQGILLSRARVIQQLEIAQSSQHRQMLQRALADLDAQLAQLG